MRLTEALCAVGCALLVACGSSADEEPPCRAAPARIELGRLQQGKFDAFERGDTVSVIHGVQGGTWIMPSIRLLEAESGGDFDARLALEDGTLLGETRRPNARLTPAEDGGLVMQFLPVPVSNEPEMPEVNSVDGASALLSVSYSRPCGPATMQEFHLTLSVVE